MHFLKIGLLVQIGFGRYFLMVQEDLFEELKLFDLLE